MPFVDFCYLTEGIHML